MDIFRATTTPAIQIHESRSDSPDSRHCSKSPSNNSSVSPSLPRPMTIPNARLDELPPPPLPPPKYIEDLAHGFDPGWTWGNSKDEFASGSTKLAPIRQGSSLHGGYLHNTTGPRPDAERPDTEMDLETSDRRGSSVSTLRSLSDLNRHQGIQIPAPIELRGERPLAQLSHEHSSNAYDQHLLAKIGKSTSSSVPRPGPRSDSIPNTRTFMPADAQPRSLSSVEIPTFGENLRTANKSSSLSPNPRANLRDYAGYQQVSSASTTTSSVSDLEHWHAWRYREDCRHSIGGSIPGPPDETNSLSSRSNRGSYDHNIPEEAEGDVPADETRAFRHLYIEDRSPSKPERRPSRPGQKRRRRSTSKDRGLEFSFPPHLNTNLEGAQRAFPPSSFPRSPNSMSQPHHGSISSVSSSGPRHGSYASSTGYSMGGSSITSISSFDKHSPGGLSPRSDIDPAHESPYTASTPLSAHVSSLPTRPIKPATSSELKPNTPLPVKTSGQSTSRVKSSGKASGAFVCACCPKKPKRFANAEDLRLHTHEKQYECSYCGNRFKNKNEAERHQNSLHLRLHSWSCAAIPGPEAAFHPKNASSTQASGPASTDCCGYCGEEFPNTPRPNWDDRKEHLAVVHKFGECNKAKKFYRADHFRQHLKHSHAGTSGKWTNMLENACMKDEPPTGDGSSPQADTSVNNDDESED